MDPAQAPGVADHQALAAGGINTFFRHSLQIFELVLLFARIQAQTDKRGAPQ
jgi:hypothetical protein